MESLLIVNDKSKYALRLSNVNYPTSERATLSNEYSQTVSKEGRPVRYERNSHRMMDHQTGKR